MSTPFVRGPIQSMDDLHREKIRLKTHLRGTQDELVAELEKLPSSLVTKLLLHKAGSIASTAGSLVLKKVLKPSTKNLGTAVGTAAKSQTLWGAIAINVGTFLAGELISRIGRKKNKEEEEDQEENSTGQKKPFLKRLFAKKK